MHISSATITQMIGDIFCITSYNTLLHIFFTRSKNRFLLILTYCFYLFGTNFIQVQFDNPICNLVFNLFCLLLITCNYESKVRTKFIAVIYTYAIMMIVETITLCISLLSGFPFAERNRDATTTMVTCILTFFFALILRHMSTRSKSYLPAGLTLSICSIPVTSILFTFIIEFNKSVTNEFILFLSMFLFGINIIAFKLYDRLILYFQEIMGLQIVKEQNRYYEKQLQIMMESQENMRRFRHDSKTRILILQTLLNHGETKKALDNLAGMNEELINRDAIVSTGNVAIDAVINYHLQRAYDNGITVQTMLHIPSDLTVDLMEIGVLLGNLLENSITASEQCTKYKEVILKMEYEKNTLFLHVENPYEGEIKYFNGKYFTTKEDRENHGLGLASIDSIVKKHNGLLEIDHSNQRFSVDITLYL